MPSEAEIIRLVATEIERLRRDVAESNSVDVCFGSDGKSMECILVGSVGFFGKRCSEALL